MYYSAMLNIVKKLVTKIGLDKSNYGTHSCRSGGTTEKFLEGKNAIWIQNFGLWNNIGSVLIYIRPNNPDMKKFVNSMAEYQELRKKEGKLMENVQADLTDLQLQVATQNNKKKSGKRKKKQDTVGVMMSNKMANQVTHSNYSNYNYNQPQRHVYSQYNEDTYQCVDGSWQFNARAKSRQVVVNQYNVQPLINAPLIPKALPPVSIDGNWKNVGKGA